MRQPLTPQCSRNRADGRAPVSRRIQRIQPLSRKISRRVDRITVGYILCGDNPAPGSKMLNVVLVRLHQVFFVLVLIAIVGITVTVDRPRIIILDVLLLALAAAHWYAAKGARLGRSYGRTSSRIVGAFWLLGFPIGTVLAIFVFVNTDKRHWKSRPDSPPSSAPTSSAPRAA